MKIAEKKKESEKEILDESRFVLELRVVVRVAARGRHHRLAVTLFAQRHHPVKNAAGKRDRQRTHRRQNRVHAEGDRHDRQTEHKNQI